MAKQTTPTQDIMVLHCPDCLRPLSMTAHRQPFCTYCGKVPAGEPVPGREASPPSSPDAASAPSSAARNVPVAAGPAPAQRFPTKEATMVLCCVECENALSTTAGGGSYCTHCGFTPSMQDTFFKLMCPHCGVETKKPKGEVRRCPKCGDRFWN